MICVIPIHSILVIVERYPAPLAKPPAIIYEKYMPTCQQPRQVIVRREICRPTGYPMTAQQAVPGQRLVREIVRQIPATTSTCQPALVCVPQQQQQQQVPQQLVPVFTQRQVIFAKSVLYWRILSGSDITYPRDIY